MMPVHPYEIPSLRLPSERSSRELRAYLRDEYQADVGWLNHFILTRSPPLHTRLRRWLAARRSRRGSESRGEAPVAVSRTQPFPSTADAEDCPHLLLEDLGFGGNADFLRCTVCGDVLVTRGASQWRIRAAEDDVTASPVERLGGEAVVVGPDEL